MLKLRIFHQANFIFLFSILFLFSSSSFANINNKLRKSDSEYPMEILSNAAEFDDKKGKATYTGTVKAKQGSRRLSSDVLTIFRDKENKISKMIAKSKGKVLAKIKAQPNPKNPVGNGKAKVIEYYPNEDKALLIGNAELEQGGDIIKGERLEYFFEKDVLISKYIPNARTKVILQPRSNKKTGK